MVNFGSWFATSPLASSLRYALSAGIVAFLNYVLEHLADFQLNPLLAVAIGAAIPPILRSLNDKDGIFGLGKTEVIDESDEEVA